MYRLYKLVFVLIRVLRLWFPGRDNACSGPCYERLKFMKDTILNVEVAVHKDIDEVGFLSATSNMHVFTGRRRLPINTTLGRI